MSYDTTQQLFKAIKNYKNELIEGKSEFARKLWEAFCASHPADIADFLASLTAKDLYLLFSRLPVHLQADVFMEFSEGIRHTLFVLCKKDEREILIKNLTIDELTDFFDDLSDVELDAYLKILNKQEREKVLSLLQFPETSAAGVMDSNVFVLSKNITVAKTIELLQRIQPDRALHRTIYVVDSRHILAGSILLEDLVLKSPEQKIESIMRAVPYKIPAFLDQSEVAQKMMHYHIDIAPVVDDRGTFLGVIPSDTLAEVIEEEASEDIFRMASMTPIRASYFETPFVKLLYQRGFILAFLLLLQSVSTFIIEKYQLLLAGFLFAYAGVVTSTGGNASSQTSALVIQGLAAGQLNHSHISRFLRREVVLSLAMASILAFIAFVRTYAFNGLLLESSIVACSLGIVVVFSTFFGALTPFILHKMNMDPAHSAGPLLTTCMDIVGVIVYCLISGIFLSK